MKQKFFPGDKVFAKVRGYPPWPARIEKTHEDSSNKSKYNVYFYGTGETATVKAEDICLFVDNKAKLGKPKKHKNFTEALLQIEEDLSPEELLKLSSATTNEETPKAKGDLDDTNVSISADESSTPTPKSGGGNRKSSTSSKQQQIKQPVSPSSAPKPKSEKKKRKADSEGTGEDPDPKKQKPSTPQSQQQQPPPPPPPSGTSAPSPTPQNETENSPTKTSPEVMSRAGRKIKPKRFADFDEVSNEEVNNQNLFNNKTQKLQMIPKIFLDNTKVKQENEDYLIATKDTENIMIPLKVNKPFFENNKLSEDWDEGVMKYAMSLKKRIECGEQIESVETLMENWTKDKASSFSSQALQVFKPTKKLLDDRNDYYTTESQLLEIDINIKEALNLKKADVKRCLKLLEQLYNLNTTSLMLKKHPDLVNTVKRLRKYIGNTSAWSMTDDEMNDFNQAAGLIRSKADLIYHRYKSLFLLPTGKQFWDFFSNELIEFSKKTRHLTMEQIFAITEDPY